MHVYTFSYNLIIYIQYVICIVYKNPYIPQYEIKTRLYCKEIDM